MTKHPLSNRCSGKSPKANEKTSDVSPNVAEAERLPEEISKLHLVTDN